MQKVLIASPNVEQRIKLCQCLANDKRLEVIETADGKTALEKYLDIKPNVLVLDSCLKDINCIEIINRLSTNIADKRNNNIILTAQKEEILNLSNAAKIYKVIYKDENSNDFYDTIKEMYLFGEYEELTNEELDLLFLTLKIPLNSNGTNYIREAIFECYYYPDLQKKLNDIFTIIGQRHNKSNSAIRSSFRTALERLNMYKGTIDCPILQYFDTKENITPKDFLEIVVMYLHLQKGKKK
jgi:CheY-like chemotaxis protein